MMKPQISDPEKLDQGKDLSSALTYLEQGLSCLMQSRLFEGLDLLRQARDQLSVGQELLGGMLDAIQEAAAGYLRAEQMLHEASRRFADADRERQSHLATLIAFLRTAQSPSLAPISVDFSARSVLSDLSGAPVSLRNMPSLVPLPSAEPDALPALYINCFGHFAVRRFDISGSPVELCRNLKGQAILRYLVTRPDHQASMDILMTDLWPEEDAEVARHKLQVAVSALRCSLNREYVQTSGGGYILCKDHVYQLNPAVEIHTDIAEFLALYQEGCRARSLVEAALCYERACRLCSGPFLTEDLYAEWSFLLREELTKAHLTMCSKLAEYNLERGNYEAAIAWAQAILKIDRCDEDAYQLLMRAYAASGRRSEALRRYQQCQQALAEELGVSPMPETQQLLQTILGSGGKGNGLVK
jgi:DNA-binding SARP family transcriptional activator